MHVKEAVRTAKEYVADLFIEEELVNVGLEEVEFDDASNRWTITIGFSRPWDRAGKTTQRENVFSTRNEATPRPRSYKVLRINDESGQIESLTDRFLKAS